MLFADNGSYNEAALLTSEHYETAAMNFNGTSASYVGGGVLILKTLAGESVEVITEPKSNKTIDIIDRIKTIDAHDITTITIK
ncbi:unnamed protein product [Parnassius apollo]|uniref:(apollo) hypothetical protein n=1 Tax=Parnassius apollo TaxID=110799 RepID=A0A8S3W3Y9_PARAO|nr:unnamed protein product [Parnassius apollo]